MKIKVNKCKCGANPKLNGSLIECSGKNCKRSVQTRTMLESVETWNVINPAKNDDAIITVTI